MNIKTDILLRAYISFGVMVVIAIAVVYKLFTVQVVEGDKWRAMQDSLSTKYVTVEPARGNIYSVDGKLLATSVPEYDIRMDLFAPGIESDDVFYSKVDSLSGSLSRFFGDKPSSQYSRLLRDARKRKNRYFLIKRNVSYQQMKSLRGFPIFNLGKYKGGMIAEQKNKRILPFQTLANRTIGYKNENVQPVGLEGAYSEYIDGVGGRRLVQRIAGGVWMPVNEGFDIDPVDGADIVSTININMQDITQTALYNQLVKSDADNGCVVLMEVQTGEIRAVANFTRVREGVYEEKFNYAIAQSAEPGSTFKLASYLVALDDGKIDTSDIVDTGDGAYRVHRHTIRDSQHGGYGKLSVKQAFGVSSNTAITKLINTHYKESPAAFTKRLHAMHMDEKLGLQIPGEGSPLIKTPASKSWSGLSLTQMSWGYELKMTPLQMLVLYNAVANDGKMISPLFVREIRKIGNTVKTFKARVINEQIASKTTIGKLKGMLEEVVENGTGKGIKNPLFKIAGKTGTAQMASGTKGYSDRKYQASFAGYFPADNPKYSMIIVIQNPRNGYYAASTAGPVFADIAEKIYASDFDMYQKTPVVQLANVDSPQIKNGSLEANRTVANAFGLNELVLNRVSDKANFTDISDVQIGMVPDVLGMGLKDALYYLGNAGYRVIVNGNGKVINQAIAAGMKHPQTEPILIELR
jgi:cell division protein FtsI (penicillin-binding protein 3)